MSHLHWANYSDCCSFVCWFWCDCFSDHSFISLCFIWTFLSVPQPGVRVWHSLIRNLSPKICWITGSPREGSARVSVWVNYQRKPSKKDKNNGEKKELEIFSVALSIGVREAYKRSKVVSWHRDINKNTLPGLNLTLSLPLTVYSRIHSVHLYGLNFLMIPNSLLSLFFGGKNVSS